MNTFPANCQGYQASVRIIADSVVSGILALSEQIRSHKGGRCYVQYVSVLIVPFFRDKPCRAVIYGRASTEHEAQVKALQNQMQWYDDIARFHPQWNVINRYIDQGITGTQVYKRDAFMQMMEDAKQHKFDLIVTREVCRFARNTVDALVCVRQLAAMGIEVYFVNDNIWTLDGDGELRLTIMATMAQKKAQNQ